MSEHRVRINEFTDPACPWAFSTEPIRRRLRWLYEGRIDWVPRMVVISETVEEQEERGFTPEKMAEAQSQIAHDHGMPIDTDPRSRLAVSRPACLAVVAARLHADERATRMLLRGLRVRNFAGGLLDDPALIDAAVTDVGLDPADVRRWCEDPAVLAELEGDKEEARAPMPAANVLDHKLANWSGGRRYTCPSYEITRISDGVTISIPGFQPFGVYDVVLANLVPGLERRKHPESVEEVLSWCGVPLATKEVAVMMDIDLAEARQRLGRVAGEHHVGVDGYWSLGSSFGFS